MKPKLSLTCFLLLSMMATHAQWSTTGNVGATPPINFLGTTDGNPLMFKVTNNQAGLIEGVSTFNTSIGIFSFFNNSSGYRSSAFGAYALNGNTSGYDNSAFGTYSLSGNQTGYGNVAMGHYTLANNYSGYYNTAIGNESSFTNAYGYDNVSVGHWSLYYNFSGARNVAIGKQALYSSGGDDNVATGYQALYSNGSSQNTAYGNYSLYSNTGGYYNTAAGFRSLYSNIGGSLNTAMGYEALSSNRYGDQNAAVGYHALLSNSSGSYNTAVGMETLNNNYSGIMNFANGYQALYYNNSGGYNTAIGTNGLFNNTSGSQNIAIGNQALFNNTTGTENIGIGYYAIGNNISAYGNVAYGDNTLPYVNYGNFNTAIGYAAGPNWDYAGSTSIGSNASALGSNEIMIGSTYASWIGGYNSWTNASDGRIKKNVQANVPGLVFIKKLNPVTYTLDLDAIDQITQPMKIKDSTNKLPSSEILNARNKKQQIVYTGFIAQDVEKAAKSIAYDFSGVAVPQNDKGIYGLRYSEFVVPLVKAVQELTGTNDSLQTQIGKLKIQNNEMQSQITNVLQQLADIKTAQAACCPAATPVKGTTTTSSLQSGGTAESATSETEINGGTASLEQNSPNPFNSSTVIRYHLPVSTTNAQIFITDVQGRKIKSYPISKGNGQIIVNGGELSAGTYFYTLGVNGRQVDTKQMILTK